jgi:hypothetical protein
MKAISSSVFLLSASFLCFGQAESDLFFSEIIEGSDNNRAVEIFNPRAEAVALSGYRIAIAVNGGGWTQFHSFPANAMLPSLARWTIVNASVNPSVFTPSNANEVIFGSPTAVSFDGDDARGLVKINGADTVFIDMIGLPKPDPGLGWEVSGITNATRDHTLIRKPKIARGNIDWELSRGTNADNSEWLVLPPDYFSNLGLHDYLPEIPVTSIEISSASGSFSIDTDQGTLDLNAIVKPANATNPVLFWSSANPSIAAVSQNGNVKAFNNGNVYIKASATDGSGIADSVQIIITSQSGRIPVQTIRLSAAGTGDTIRTNQGSLQVVAEVLPADASDKRLIWSCSNDSVLRVDQNGLVTAKRNGYAVIKALALDGSEVTGEIKITATEQYYVINNISQLRLMPRGDGTFYHLQSELTVTHWLFFNNTKYAEDATGAMEIIDPGKKITSDYKTGDVMPGLKGYLEDVNGMLQFRPLEDPGPPVSSGVAVNPYNTNLNQINKNPVAYEAKLVKINNVRFADAGSTFSNGANYRVFAGKDTGVFSTSFYNADYIGKPIPDSAKITGIVINSKGTAKLVARKLTDIDTNFNTSVEPFKASGPSINMYPNPATSMISVRYETEIPVESIVILTDLSGRRILQSHYMLSSSPVDIPLSNVESGLYFLNIFMHEERLSIKLVIRK